MADKTSSGALTAMNRYIQKLFLPHRKLENPRDMNGKKMIHLKSKTDVLNLGKFDQKEDAFDIYNYLRKRFSLGVNDAFLLESLGVNPIDSKESVIGINPVVKLDVIGSNIFIEGASSLVDTILSSLSGSYGSPTQGSNAITLKRKADVWDFIRDLEKLFEATGDNRERGTLFFGYFGYDTIYYVEELPQRHASTKNLPDISLSLYQHILTLGGEAAYLTTYEFGESNRHDSMLEALTHVAPPLDQSAVNSKSQFSFQFETDKKNYLDKVKKALSYVEIGDIYQVQIGQKLMVSSDRSPEDVYQSLRHLNPSPYMYLFGIGDTVVVGASPELFVRTNSSEVLMRPIAGTLGKHQVRNKEEAIKHLHGNEKEVAEHLMLVDLCRNDLHRVCEPASVEVSDLLSIEEYSHVFHMVSSTRGTLERDLDKIDLIRATFPAGTMTGAPKIRAIEIIDELEDSNRGIYAGAIGLIGFGSQFVNTALCIRTATCKSSTYSLRASAGIVSDSDEESEYFETLHKLSSMFKAITGEELSCQLK